MLKPILSICTLAAALAFTGCESMQSPTVPNATQQHALSLADRTWVATEINGADVIVDEAFSAKRPALKIDAAGKRFAGADGCNGIQGNVDLKGNQIAFGQIASTLMACSGASDTISRNFSQALEQTARFEIKGHELRFFDKSGKELAKFVTVIKPLPL